MTRLHNILGILITVIFLLAIFFFSKALEKNSLDNIALHQPVITDYEFVRECLDGRVVRLYDDSLQCDIIYHSCIDTLDSNKYMRGD